MKFLNLQFGRTVGAVVCFGVAVIPVSASAVTVEIAKKCEALTIQTYPPLEPGNPALGSAKGNELAERNYYEKCIANGGNVEEPSAGTSPAGPDPPK